MKVKQSMLKVSIAVFGIAAIIALPLRTYQFFSVLEPRTGFYSEMNFSVWALYAVVLAAIVIVVAGSFVARNNCGYITEVKSRPGQGVLSFLTAGALVMDAVSCYTMYSSGMEDYITADSASAIIGTKIIAAQGVVAIVAAIYFALSGIVMLLGKSIGNEFKILSLSPAAWCTMRMIFRFTRTISYIRVSDLFFELVMLAFMLLFFMAFAQLNSGIEGEKMDWKIPGYGLPAALMALICFIPRIIVTLSGNAEMLYEQSPAEYCDFAVALLILSIVFTRVGGKLPAAQANEEAETQDDTQEEETEETEETQKN